MARTYDIEIQIPSMNGYKEVSSVSNARDYQARRGNMRVRRASGKIESINSSNGTPSAVTVSGKTYTIGSTDAAYQLSALSGTAAGNYITLLLGMEDKVAGVLSGSAVNGTYYGVVQSCVKSAAEEKAAIQTEISVFCTDGTVRSFVTQRELSFSAGSVVMVNITDGGVDVRTAASSYITGRVSSDAGTVGDLSFAENVEIIDAGTDGSAAAIELSRIADMYLAGEDVRFYMCNTAGEIEKLILNDLTGDTWTYGLLTEENVQGSGWLISSASYTFFVNGKRTSFSSGSTSYAVDPGGIAIRYASNGSIKTMRQLAALNIRHMENGMAASADNSVPIAEKVQVYLAKNGEYYLTELSAVNAYDYSLTGWYDDFNGQAGGRLRVIVAIPKAY